GNKISLFGRIISASDVYDAITSDRPYRKALPPHEGLEFLMGNSGTAFDPEIIKVFSKVIAPYPIGTCVRLSDDSIGLVVENYENYGMRPKVKIFRQGEKDVAPYHVDLRSDRNYLNIVIKGTV
ncbi:MAG: hypothetical protein K0R31_2170, partial [Clostridiales bacterium]|nr:hypothetical protein [Clostridiales bacterium]